jgi:hypothetical protein
MNRAFSLSHRDLYARHLTQQAVPRAAATPEVEKYSALADQTVTATTNIRGLHKEQDAAAAAFMGAANAYLAGKSGIFSPIICYF